MNKSHVSMEQHRCPICGVTHDTGSILLDKLLRPQFDKHTVTGFSPCPEHQKQLDEGYIALVEIDPAKSAPRDGHIKQEEAHRTGRYAMVRRTAWENIFNSPAPAHAPLAFIDIEAFEQLSKITGVPAT